MLGQQNCYFVQRSERCDFHGELEVFVYQKQKIQFESFFRQNEKLDEIE
jgi:hypothetical protein